MTFVTGVPVKLNGRVIGTARVYDNGRLDMTLDVATEAGRELYEMITFGLVGAMSINQIPTPTAPAVPAIPEHHIPENPPWMKSWEDLVGHNID